MSTTTQSIQERNELHRAIWQIANDLRGSVDGWDFKAYVLGMLFYRFISENLTNFINAEEKRQVHLSISAMRAFPTRTQKSDGKTPLKKKASTSCRRSLSRRCVHQEEVDSLGQGCDTLELLSAKNQLCEFFLGNAIKRLSFP